MKTANKSHRRPSAALIASIFAASAAAVLAAPESEWKKPGENKIHAQVLVDRLMGGADDFMVVAVHTTPRGAGTFQIVACNLPIIGKEDDAGDLLVDKDARSAVVPIVKESRLSIMLPLKDAAGNNIGALALVTHYHAGDDETKRFVRAAEIRDSLRAEIPNADSLFKPEP